MAFLLRGKACAIGRGQFKRRNGPALGVISSLCRNTCSGLRRSFPLCSFHLIRLLHHLRVNSDLIFTDIACTHLRIAKYVVSVHIVALVSQPLFSITQKLPSSTSVPHWLIFVSSRCTHTRLQQGPHRSISPNPQLPITCNVHLNTSHHGRSRSQASAQP